MAKDLYTRPEKGPIPTMRSGVPDVAEAVGVTIEAHRELGFTPDIEQATESLTTDFAALAELGYDGRLYVEPPTTVKTDEIIAAADRKRPEGVDRVYRHSSLWVPGTNKNSYGAEEIDAAGEEPEARLAVFNAADTGADPVLHFTGMPYDEYRGGAVKSQTEAVEEAQGEFGSKHPGNQLYALGHRAVTILVLMDRIRGVDPRSKEFVLNRGTMVLPELGRRRITTSLVGRVIVKNGQLNLTWTTGRAQTSQGVGLSLG